MRFCVMDCHDLYVLLRMDLKHDIDHQTFNQVKTFYWVYEKISAKQMSVSMWDAMTLDSSYCLTS